MTGLVWVVWFFAIVRGSREEWLQGVRRFSAIALVVMVLYVVSQSDALIRLHFELSRPAFDAALADVPFGSGVDPSDRMVGLYQIRWAYPADGGILFEVAGTGGGFFVGGGGSFWTDDESRHAAAGWRGA